MNIQETAGNSQNSDCRAFKNKQFAGLEFSEQADMAGQEADLTIPARGQNQVNLIP